MEVAVGAQFETASLVTAAHLGAFWQQVRSKFPTVEQQPPVLSAIERFGGMPNAGQFQRVEINVAASPRFWFVSADNEELLQVQSDRVVRNWRKLSGTGPYPRFAVHVLPQFLDSMRALFAFLEEAGVGLPRVNQCEVIYVNQIRPLPGVWKQHGEAGRVFKAWDFSRTPVLAEDLDAFSIGTSHLIQHEHQPIGRLHQTLNAAWDTSGSPATPIFAQQLVARVHPNTEEGEEGVKRAIETAHDAVIDAFLESTTDEAKQMWGYEP